MEQRDRASLAYKKARSNLLGMTILTAINIVLMMAEVNYYFSFSAIIPVSAFYLEESTGETGLAAIGFIIAAVCIGLYFLCFIMSKKNSGWLIAALVLFSLDTLFLLPALAGEIDSSLVFCLAFHAWVLYYLITGVVAGARLKQLPLVYEPEMVEAGIEYGTGTAELPPSSVQDDLPIRAAENTVKRPKVLIHTQYEGMDILVRRTYGLTELIIDGYVYAERKGVMETPYILRATVKGVAFKTEFETAGIPAQTLYAGNTLLGKKNRLF